MDRSLDELNAAVRDRICDLCAGRDTQPGCRQKPGGRCSRSFPKLPLRSGRWPAATSINPFREIRSRVCSQQMEQAVDGACPSRHAVRCALAAYLPPVAEAVEKASGRASRRSAMRTVSAPAIAGAGASTGF